MSSRVSHYCEKSTTMTNSQSVGSALLRPAVQTLLERLHSLADARDDSIVQQVVGDGSGMKSVSSEQKAALLSDALLPVSPDAGRFLYGVARSIKAKHIIEFGTSYGISTIYFAAAISDNGGGRVIGSELSSIKVAKATQHLAEAGLSQFVEIRAGDALETLRHLDGPVDLLFLDGWKELTLDVLKLVAGNLRPGSLVLADDVQLFPEAMAPYLDYIRTPSNGYISAMLPIGDGIEYSVKL